MWHIKKEISINFKIKYQIIITKILNNYKKINVIEIVVQG